MCVERRRGGGGGGVGVITNPNGLGEEESKRKEEEKRIREISCRSNPFEDTVYLGETRPRLNQGTRRNLNSIPLFKMEVLLKGHASQNKHKRFAPS